MNFETMNFDEMLEQVQGIWSHLTDDTSKIDFRTYFDPGTSLEPRAEVELNFNDKE